MCGIFGKTKFKENEQEKLEKGLELLKHRGPDQEGIYFDSNIFMGHRRLSILDLSENGKQPMFSESKNIVLTINGEIYNFKEIKKDLEKEYTFKSKSDSEVIIYGYLKWGIDKLLSKIDGMFAFSLYDKKLEKLYLVRDRVGIKPLYYSTVNGEICWSSELKSIEYFYSKQNLDIDHTAIYDFLTYRYIPAPKTKYKNIFKLEPSHYIEITVNNPEQMKSICYWKPKLSLNSNRSFEETCKAFRDELLKSVSSQLISDVPVGLFLSGGLDSASIASCLPENSNFKTFTIGFDNKNYDESTSALQISEHFKLKNIREVFKSNEIEKMFKMNLEWFDEPAYNSSNFPVYQLSKLTRKYCTVALSGDGGDELFGGYKWYDFMVKFNKIRLPFFSFMRPLLKLGFNFPIKKVSKLFKAIDLIISRDILEVYSIVLGGLNQLEKGIYRSKLGIEPEYDDYWFFRKFDNAKLDLKSRFQLIDFHTFLPEACLTKIDRTSMQNSLECRVPLLSNSMINFAFSIPPKFRFKDNKLKGIMKESMKEILPKKILGMKKKGFSAPIRPNSEKENIKEHLEYFKFLNFMENGQ